MPTYAYKCPECEHEFDVFKKKATKPRARKCPACGKRARPVITGGAGFLFKGEGFYITDYRSQEYRKRAKSETGSPESDGTSRDKDAGAKGTSDSGKEGGSSTGKGSEAKE